MILKYVHLSISFIWLYVFLSDTLGSCKISLKNTSKVLFNHKYFQYLRYIFKCLARQEIDFTVFNKVYHFFQNDS